MPNSPLSFASTSSFRNALLSKNLSPYGVTGVYSPSSSDLDTETVLSAFNVIDSPNELIAEDTFAAQLYPLNQFGPNEGYNTTIDYNGVPQPVNSNQGEYSPDDTALDLVNEFFIDSAYVSNYFGPIGGYNDLVEITNNGYLGEPLHIPYNSNFVPSTYSPYSILLSDNPDGDNGSLSQDSYMARLASQKLKESFQYRIDREIFINTVGIVNLQSLQDPFEASLLISGQQPLIYKDWTITVPENPIVGAIDLVTKLAGAYWPVSLIPGDYFDDNTKNGQTPQTSNALNVANQLTGGLLSPILNKKRNPSEIFLANTGNGQRSSLFNNLEYNRYQPGYNGQYGGILGIGQAIFDAVLNSNGTLTGGYYVGSKTAEPSTITSPANQVPVNAFGQQTESPVYGPSELGILFEGNSDLLNFGLAAKSSSDEGGLDGGFVWTSPKYKPAAGFNATPGGGQGSADDGFNLISSNYTRDESTNITFKETSILDETQRLVNSADNVQGVARLKHVGNAINQVSKVFHDGYKEMTKGSQVVSYTDQTTGGEAGIEYCRVFAKDTPYYTYADLQKTDGITTSGRRFTNSVLDNTFNLNIAPMRNPGSTNIVPDGDEPFDLLGSGRGGYAKKYMFSIENLAWRTSSKPGFTYDELPVCEKGPNGGRVMWFPPYDLTFSDSSNASWTPTSFLGRPEPIYTYKDTKRSGTLSWKIIVDHPSIMNTIVEKQLKGQKKDRINSIMDSFFAGCVKYDIYTLAQKFNTIPIKDLYTYQTILTNPKSTEQDITQVKDEIGKLNTTTSTDTPKTNPDTSLTDFENRYKEFAFYFENDIPGPPKKGATTASSSYLSDYNTYVDNMNIGRYQSIADGLFNPGSTSKNTTDFFKNVVIENFKFITQGEKNFFTDALNILKNKKGVIAIDMIASASAPASQSYNVDLSKRRYDSVITFLRTFSVGNETLAKYIDDKTFIINPPTAAGETISIPISPLGLGSQVNCTEDIKAQINPSKDTNKQAQVYSVNAMACRRVKIRNIKVTPVPTPTPIPEPPVVVPPSTGSTTPPPKPVITIQQKIKEGITKKIIRQMLSECNYFEAIKESSPMVYDSIQDKIKYFNPAFHSMTPEGLNSRLTFLNQCVRPGETIPVIGTDGNPKYNDAANTAFGAPPVLVLRIGDFYNTKIIPNSLSFSYEPLLLDMNPEGIGVQPMLAKVTLGFDMIGGMGLAKPVEELQNALSFNYYANTEIYDERATWTEDTSALDAQTVQAIVGAQPTVSSNNVDNQQTNDAGTTIGDIMTTVPSGDGDIGDINYKSIMDKLLDVTKEYYTNIVNQAESTTKSYNDGIWQLMCKSRQYINGEFTLPVQPLKVPIFGKSTFQSSIDELFTTVNADIDSGTNVLIVGLKALQYNDETVIKRVKDNLKKYINDYKAEFSNGVAQIVNNITQQEQTMVQVFRKVNLVTTLTDGLIINNLGPKIYSISGTSEVDKGSDGPPADTFEELWRDFEIVGQKVDSYNKFISNPTQGVIPSLTYDKPGSFTPSSPSFEGDSYVDNSFFMVMAQIFNNKNKLQSFKTTIISGDLSKITSPSSLTKQFDKICDSFKDRVVKELGAETKRYVNIKKNAEYVTYLKTTAYNKGKSRKFTYTTTPNPTTVAKQSTDLQLLYKGNNNGDKDIWTDKTQFN
jgi:hypothetical protein